MCRAAKSHRTTGLALRMHFARAILAAATLRGYAQLPLQFVKRSAFARHFGNVSIGDSVANTNDHVSILN
jgi:hypothetical protein